MFSDIEALQRDQLEKKASSLGLDLAKFRAALDSDPYRAHLEQDLLQAEALRINATPTFFLNGRRLVGSEPIEFFKQKIDEELERQAPADAGASPAVPRGPPAKEQSDVRAGS